MCLGAESGPSQTDTRLRRQGRAGSRKQTRPESTLWQSLVNGSPATHHHRPLPQWLPSSPPPPPPPPHTHPRPLPDPNPCLTPRFEQAAFATRVSIQVLTPVFLHSLSLTPLPLPSPSPCKRTGQSFEGFTGIRCSFLRSPLWQLSPSQLLQIWGEEFSAWKGFFPWLPRLSPPPPSSPSLRCVQASSCWAVSCFSFFPLSIYSRPALVGQWSGAGSRLVARLLGMWVTDLSYRNWYEAVTFLFLYLYGAVAFFSTSRFSLNCYRSVASSRAFSTHGQRSISSSPSVAVEQSRISTSSCYRPTASCYRPITYLHVFFPKLL